jgi:FkbM family methyltransferase
MPLRRSCRDLILGQVLGWQPGSYLLESQALLEVSLDMILSDYRRSHQEVVFLQIGAFDGVFGDPIYPLIDRHLLRGFLIEPQRDMFNRLKSNYARFESSRFVFANTAITERDGLVPLYRVRADADGPEWLRGIASLDRDVLMRHTRMFPELESVIEVECVPGTTFTSLFREFGIGHVDLLQIDAEGCDGRILRLFDVPSRKPAIIQFEHKHLDIGDYKNCLESLIDQGYRVAHGPADTLAYNPQY